MATYMRNYRASNPEFYEREKQRNADYINKKYNEDPEYKERKKKYAIERYYKLKELKKAQSSVDKE